MKASELIKELQNCIDKYGDLEVKYDEWCDIDGAAVYNIAWTGTEMDRLFPPDRILINQHDDYGCKK